MLHQRFVALFDRAGPSCLVADLGGSGDAGLVAGLADRLKDLLTAHAGACACRTGERDFANRLDAREHLRLGRAGVIASDAGDQLREQQEEHDRNQERKRQHDRQLLGRFYR